MRWAIERCDLARTGPSPDGGLTTGAHTWRVPAAASDRYPPVTVGLPTAALSQVSGTPTVSMVHTAPSGLARGPSGGPGRKQETCRPRPDVVQALQCPTTVSQWTRFGSGSPARVSAGPSLEAIQAAWDARGFGEQGMPPDHPADPFKRNKRDEYITRVNHPIAVVFRYRAQSSTASGRRRSSACPITRIAGRPRDQDRPTRHPMNHRRCQREGAP